MYSIWNRIAGKLRRERKQYIYSHERDIVPIEYRILHERRLVLAKGHGTLTDQEVFGYQRDVWSLPEVAGYDELVDMTQVQDIALPSTQRVRALAVSLPTWTFLRRHRGSPSSRRPSLPSG